MRPAVNVITQEDEPVTFLIIGILKRLHESSEIAADVAYDECFHPAFLKDKRIED